MFDDLRSLAVNTDCLGDTVPVAYTPASIYARCQQRRPYGHYTQADEYAAGDVALPAQVVTLTLDPASSRAGDQGIEAITYQADYCERQTEEADLRRHHDAQPPGRLVAFGRATEVGFTLTANAMPGFPALRRFSGRIGLAVSIGSHQ
jgi:hypothetical protein